MFTRIKEPRIAIYDGDTNEFIGLASFKPTSEAQKALLQLVNYGINPSSLTLLDIDLYEPSKGYVPPTPYNSYNRTGTISALFTDSYTGIDYPIEIQISYKARARGNLLGNLYHFDSVEFSDIDVESVKISY